MNSGNRPHNRDSPKEHLVPPGGDSAPSQTNRRKTLLAVVLAFTLLLGGAVGVLLFLPADKEVLTVPPPSGDTRLSETPQPAAVETAGRQQPEAAETLQPKDAPADSARADSTAQAREQVWALKIEAEAQGIGEWAAAEYGQIAAQLDQADALFREEAWQNAANVYQSALSALQALLDSKQQRYREAISAGRQALADERPEAAGGHFGRALTIEPSSTEARAGIATAQQLGELLADFQRALSHEERGELAEAAARLEEIVNSGVGYEPARAASERVREKLNQSRFQQEMNRVYAALEAGDFVSARRSLQTLEALGIRQQEVAQAGALLVEKQTRADIARLKAEAELSEDQEQWQQAVELYQAILKLDPDLLFAAAGRQEAARRAELDRSLHDAVERAHRLQDQAQLSAAADLLDFARQIEPQGPQLRAQIAALDGLIEKYRTPITVTLESDNQTLVTIYRVGRIAPFLTRRIDLKPGTYTLVGSRAGYRDVRMQITVGPESGEHRYQIICEEAI